VRRSPRYYDPLLARFTSSDSLGLGGGQANFFAYVGNSPTNFIDPTGQLWGVAGAIGAAAAFAAYELAKHASGSGGGGSGNDSSGGGGGGGGGGPQSGPTIGTPNGVVPGSPQLGSYSLPKSAANQAIRIRRSRGWLAAALVWLPARSAMESLRAPESALGTASSLVWS
jgi:uncharacterized protein RhaS with RHS repeats